MMWGPYGYGTGWGWMMVGWIMMVVFWGLVIVGIVALIRWVNSRNVPGRAGYSERPMEILRRRYAAGEITKEQYETMKRDIA